MLIGCARWHGNPDMLKEIYSLGNLKILFGARNNKTLFSGADQRKIIVSSQKGVPPGWGWSAHKTKMHVVPCHGLIKQPSAQYLFIFYVNLIF